jgi:hypothetical protein
MVLWQFRDALELVVRVTAEGMICRRDDLSVSERDQRGRESEEKAILTLEPAMSLSKQEAAEIPDSDNGPVGVPEDVLGKGGEDGVVA